MENKEQKLIKLLEEAQDMVLELEHKALVEDNPVAIRKIDHQQEMILGRIKRFEDSILSTIKKNHLDWLDSVFERLEDLQQKEIISKEALAEDDGFTATFLHANEMAARTHHKEKLEALRNAVINAALPDAPDNSLQIIMLDKLDKLLPAHIIYLERTRVDKDFALNPRILNAKVVQDLIAFGLYYQYYDEDDYSQYEVSDWGKALLDFIKTYEPDEPKADSGAAK